MPFHGRLQSINVLSQTIIFKTAWYHLNGQINTCSLNVYVINNNNYNNHIDNNFYSPVSQRFNSAVQ